MARNWVITSYHYDDPEVFKKVWDYDHSNSVISIGWSLMGDLANLSEDEIERRYFEVFNADSTRTGLNQVIRFWRAIQPGDRVIARGGRKRILDVGTVAGSAFYDAQRGRERARMGGDAQIYEYFLPVRWDGIEREFPNQVFGMLTVYELPEEKFMQLVNGGPPVDGEPNWDSRNSPSEDIGDSNSSSEQSFALERYLEEFMVSNFHQVFNGELEIFQDSEGFTRQQYRTDVGTIDILARDRHTGDYVVIELKRVQGSDQTIGQILRYMGWVQEHLSRGSNKVRGMVICQTGDERLDYALRMIPNVDAKFYKVDFKLTDSKNIPAH